MRYDEWAGKHLHICLQKLLQIAALSINGAEKVVCGIFVCCCF